MTISFFLAFLILFLLIGVFYQRLPDISAFYISIASLSIYIYVHFGYNLRQVTGGEKAILLVIIPIRYVLACFIFLCKDSIRIHGCT